ncbi:C-type polyheme cytochrome OmcC (plasmid) [Pseudooceanicola algae]|uniref:C-type polyheme cytochrome OmcC n=2 Tax=Pseudooceanicola algae TaxID=1537215 RepID=A0A418SD31_9RHOB|nr:C-type polyheme cytochrome OmcC [Pseudooceanicola algae]
MAKRFGPLAPLFAMTCGLLLLAGGHFALGQEAEGEDTTDAVPYAMPKSGPFSPSDIEIQNNQAISDWFRSGHADAASEAFSHWDEEEVVNPVCATCHSGEGFRDFHGLDGTPAGSVEGPINTGGVVDCGTCHNPGLAGIREVAFPSGLMHPVEGVEAACMTCHQGRTSGKDVEAATADRDLDTPSADLRFINPHYATAAASWLGGYGGAGYHYAGKEYSGRFFHARPVSSCNSCHEPHTLEIEFDTCLTCHEASSVEEIRIARQSYDGSGDLSKGIRSDIQANAAVLMALIEDYTRDIAGAAFVYDSHRYPYFFADANADGLADEQDGQPVAFSSWTPRSLRAVYNWKLIAADPGNFAHNPPYMLELLHDSIEDLSGSLGQDVQDMGILR